MFHLLLLMLLLLLLLWTLSLTLTLSTTTTTPERWFLFTGTAALLHAVESDGGRRLENGATVSLQRWIYLGLSRPRTFRPCGSSFFSLSRGARVSFPCDRPTRSLAPRSCLFSVVVPCGPRSQATPPVVPRYCGFAQQQHFHKINCSLLIIVRRLSWPSQGPLLYVLSKISRSPKCVVLMVVVPRGSESDLRINYVHFIGSPIGENFQFVTHCAVSIN